MDVGALALILLNTLSSLGGVVYLIRVEHRFTKLETQMAIVLQQLALMKE